MIRTSLSYGTYETIPRCDKYFFRHRDFWPCELFEVSILANYFSEYFTYAFRYKASTHREYSWERSIIVVFSPDCTRNPSPKAFSFFYLAASESQPHPSPKARGRENNGFSISESSVDRAARTAAIDGQTVRHHPSVQQFRILRTWIVLFIIHWCVIITKKRKAQKSYSLG